MQGEILETKRFVYGFNHSIDKLWPACLSKQLSIDPTRGYGNQTMAVNEATGSKSGVNARFVEFLNQGWPAVALVAEKDIEAGSEILADYGEDTKVMRTVEEQVRRPEPALAPAQPRHSPWSAPTAQ